MKIYNVKFFPLEYAGNFIAVGRHPKITLGTKTTLKCPGRTKQNIILWRFALITGGTLGNYPNIVAFFLKAAIQMHYNLWHAPWPIQHIVGAN